MLDRFYDKKHGGFFFTEAGAPDMIVRQKTASDSPLPSGNAVAAMVLMELGMHPQAQATLSLYAEQMREYGEGMSSLVQAALLSVQKFGAWDTASVAPRSEARASVEKRAADVVSVSVEWHTPRQLWVWLDIAEHFHLNAHDAAAAGIDLVATRLTIADAPEGTELDYPPAPARRFAFAEQPLRVYEGRVKIVVNFPDGGSLPLPLQLNLTYQACSDHACLAPVTTHLQLESR